MYVRAKPKLSSQLTDILCCKGSVEVKPGTTFESVHVDECNSDDGIVSNCIAATVC